jgi:hypothetical protein
MKKVLSAISAPYIKLVSFKIVLLLPHCDKVFAGVVGLTPV